MSGAVLNISHSRYSLTCLYEYLIDNCSFQDLRSKWQQRLEFDCQVYFQYDPITIKLFILMTKCRNYQGTLLHDCFVLSDWWGWAGVLCSVLTIELTLQKYVLIFVYYPSSNNNNNNNNNNNTRSSNYKTAWSRYCCSFPLRDEIARQALRHW